jgi:hypothetical protein
MRFSLYRYRNHCAYVSFQLKAHIQSSEKSWPWALRPLIWKYVGGAAYLDLFDMIDVRLDCASCLLQLLL